MDKRRKQLLLEFNQKFPTKTKTLKMASGPKKNVKNLTGKTTLKHKILLKGRRKSTIDIHDDNLARTPVVYSLPNGKDYYIYLKVKPQQQQTQTQTFQQTSKAVQGASSLPSKTFLVTVYGEQLEGAEEKLRQALSKPVGTTSRPCDCPCCPCACSSPKPVNEFDCSCEKPLECPCQSEQAEHNRPSPGDQTLMIFPKAGHPLGNSGCICPCCLCSCSQPGHENYDCGCQKSPPVPCPCSATSNTETQFQTTALTYSDSNCQCQPSSPTLCSCPTNLSPNTAVPNGNQVAPWMGGSPSDQTCSCPCCPCACSQFASYPSYQCGCASQPATPCPCANDASLSSQSPSGNNVVRSSESYVYPTSYPPSPAPYPSYQCDCANQPSIPCSCANDALSFSRSPSDNVVRSSESYVYPTSYLSAPSNTAVSQGHTFQEGGYEIEDTCDCFCCPCSCPETVPFENNQCSCGAERHVSCTCKRTNVH